MDDAALKLYRIKDSAVTDIAAVHIVAQTKQQASQQAKRDGCLLPKLQLLACADHDVKVTKKEWSLWFEQIASFQETSVPIDQSFQLILECTESKQLRSATLWVWQSMRSGSSISFAIGSIKHLDAHIKAMLIGVDEVGNIGSLCRAVQQLFAIDLALKSKLWSAVSYPALLLVAGGGLVFFMLTVVVPGYAEFFQQQRAAMPESLVHMVALNAWLQSLSTGAWVLSVGAFVAVVRFFLKNPRHLPIWNTWWLKNLDLLRISQLMHIMSQQDVSLDKSLGIARMVCQSTEYQVALQRVQSGILEGKRLSVCFLQGALWPSQWTIYMQLGENDGNYVRSWQQASKSAESQLYQKLNYLTKFLEPILILCFGGIMAFLLIALYAPIFSLGTAL